MKLGELALKTAQQGPMTLLDRLRQGQRNELSQGQYATRRSEGPTPEQAAGFVTPLQGIQEGASSLLGPIGGLAAGVGAPFIENILGRMGVDANSPYQVEYGGDPAAFREQQRVLTEMQTQQLVNRGQVAGRLVDAIGSFVKDKFGMDPSMVTGFLKRMPPAQLGMFVQQASAALPELETVMSRIDPSYIADFGPIVKATYMKNNGEFTEQGFRNTLGEFQQAYQGGQFGGIPAQVAMHSMSKAIEDLGPKASVRDAANLARAADSFVRSGLAPSFGAAMTLVSHVDPQGKSYRNPGKAVQYAKHLDRLARSGGIDKQQIYQATQVAQQQGISPGAAMQAVVSGGRVQSKLGPGGQQYSDMAADAMTRVERSDNMKLVAALHENDPNARKAIEKAVARGDAGTLQRLAQRARYNPEIMARKDLADTSGFVNQIAFDNPRILEGFVMGEARAHAKQTGNRQLQRVLSDPKQLQRRLRERDFSGLNTGTVRALSTQGTNQGRLAGTVLGVGDDARGRGLNPARQLKLPKPTPAETAAPKRFGMDFPEPPQRFGE